MDLWTSRMLLLGRARVHDLQAACGASMYVPVTPHGFNMNYMYIYICIWMSILVDVCIHMIYLYLYFSFSLSLYYLYLSIYIYIYIYLYTLSPSETYWFRFCYCVLQWFLLVSPSKAASIFFIHLKTLDVWAWWIMMFSCVHTMTYFDGICIVFDYRIVLPTKGFNSNMDRMRTDLWPNVNFKLLHEFLQCFCSFLWHMKFLILYAFRSCRHIIWWSTW